VPAPSGSLVRSAWSTARKRGRDHPAAGMAGHGALHHHRPQSRLLNAVSGGRARPPYQARAGSNTPGPAKGPTVEGPGSAVGIPRRMGQIVRTFWVCGSFLVLIDLELHSLVLKV